GQRAGRRSIPQVRCAGNSRRFPAAGPARSWALRLDVSLRPARAALGDGLGGAQEPAHSEPSAPMPVNHKKSHYTGGKLNGTYPNKRKRHILRASSRLVGRARRNMWDSGNFPTRWRAEPDLSRERAIERAQHGAGDRGGAVAAAEFARLEARGKGAVDGGLDGAGGVCGPVMAMTVGEPVEHERGGENHGGRIG